MTIPTRIIGIDFSGRKNAGSHIWISVGFATKDGFKLEDCFPASGLPGSLPSRDICLPELRNFISAQGACVCGMDFPFGLPYRLIKEASWEEFVIGFGKHYQTPEDFKKTSFISMGSHECLRETDKESKTPWCPYNLRLFRQTYFGIRDLLAPLVKENLASFLPMQQPIEGKPWVIEVCPASTLKKLGLYQDYHYKGSKDENRDARKKLFRRLEADTQLIIDDSVRSKAQDNRGGDALDSIIAAIAAYNSRDKLIGSQLLRMPYKIEGYVYL